MSDQPSKSEEQHRIDTLREMANTEHQLRMARTQYESAKWELVRASEALLEWQNQWSRERSAVFACYPDAMPVDSVVEDARATMDRFCADIEARHAAYGKPVPTHDTFEAEKAVAREQLEREDDASEFAELDLPPMDSERAEIILSLLTDEAPALNADMQDEREQPVEDGYAPVTNPEADAWSAPVETTPGTLAEYVPPTNPEADALAKAHDYYDPKAVADRDRNAGMARLFSYTPFHKPKVDA